MISIVLEQEEAKIDSLRGEVSHFFQKAVLDLIIAAVVGALLAAILAVFITRNITNALRGVIDMIKDIAEGEGDLTKRVDVASKDEIGELAGWFNKFVEKLHDVICEVKNNTNEVEAAATERD